MSAEDIEVFVCMNVDCKSRGAQDVLERLNERLDELGLDHIAPEPYLCFSACKHGPNMVIPSKRCWFSGVAIEDIEEIIQYLDGGAEIPRLTRNNDPGLERLIFDIMDAGLLPGRGDFF